MFTKNLENARMDLSDDQLRELAGDASFRRDREHAYQGRVQIGTRTETTISATVRGTQRYEVPLTQQDPDYEWACNCPAAAGLAAASMSSRSLSLRARTQRRPP